MKAFFYAFPPKVNTFVSLFFIQFFIQFYTASTVYTVLYSLYSLSFFVFIVFLCFLLTFSCPHQTVDKYRKYLFTLMNRTMDNCPPFNTFVGECHCQIYWTRCIKLNETDQIFGNLGWFVDDKGEQQPVWTALPNSSQAYKELKHCSC